MRILYKIMSVILIVMILSTNLSVVYGGKNYNTVELNGTQGKIIKGTEKNEYIHYIYGTSYGNDAGTKDWKKANKELYKKIPYPIRVNIKELINDKDWPAWGGYYNKRTTTIEWGTHYEKTYGLYGTIYIRFYSNGSGGINIGFQGAGQIWGGNYLKTRIDFGKETKRWYL